MRTSETRLNDVVDELEDVVLLDAEDVPTELGEDTVTPSVMPLSLLVVRPIHLDDEADR